VQVVGDRDSEQVFDGPGEPDPDFWSFNTPAAMELLTIQADNGKPVTAAVREHLERLQLRALETAHPHEYRVRRVSDQLEIALTGKREAERYAHALEEQLAELHHQVLELAEDKGRPRAAWEAEYKRLNRETGEITKSLQIINTLC
jgi:hypothetical protein